MTRYATAWVIVLALILFVAVFTIMAFNPDLTEGACEYYTPNPPNEPTGVKGCEVYGEGFASQWGGPGVARNDCVYPWADCQPIRITSLDTGISVDVTPRMYCDCYTGTPEWRIVDLDPPTLAALGLDPSLGLHRVTVEPIGIPVADVALPDTAMAIDVDVSGEWYEWLLLGLIFSVLASAARYIGWALAELLFQKKP